MTVSLPLLDRMELLEIQRRRQVLQRQLRLGGVPARTRIRREQELARLTALQIQMEQKLDIGKMR